MMAEAASRVRETTGRNGPLVGCDDPIRAVAANIAATTFAMLPGDAVEGARKSILDACATTLAGSSAPGVREVLEVLRSWGGRKDATVAVFGGKLPAHNAVLANVMMCHALEIDDSHYPAIVHPTAPTLWSALAIAERRGGVGGEELICAVVLGIDTMARIALAAPNTLDNGYHTALYSGFGAAAVAGKLLGLTEPQLAHALGITFAQAAASVQAGADGALVKRLQPCFNASAGVKAVELACAGITGVQKVMEGQFGIGRLFNHAPIDRERMLDRLGTYFLAAELTTKRYPTSRCAHAPIEGTIALVSANGLEADDVDVIEIAVQPSCHRREAKPFDPHEGTPQVKAQFSLDYCVAAAAVWRDVFIREMQDEAIFDSRVLALAKRVRIVEYRERPGSTPYLPVRVSIRAHDGREYSIEVTRLRGSPEDPLSWDDIVRERLERCAAFSAVPFPRSGMRGLVNACRHLEALEDARALVRLMVPRGAAEKR